MSDLEEMTLGMLVDILVVRRLEHDEPSKHYATQAEIEAF